METAELRQDTFSYVVNHMKIKREGSTILFTFDEHNNNREIVLVYEYDVYNNKVLENTFTSYNYDIKLDSLQESLFNNLIDLEAKKLVEYNASKKKNDEDFYKYNEIG